MQRRGVQALIVSIAASVGLVTAEASVQPTRAAATALGGVVKVAAGGQHSCAVVIGGSVRCWGANHVGQLGNASTVDSPIAVAVAGLGAAATEIATSWDHNCALLSGGIVKCWGSNADRELGDGTRSARSVAVPVADLPARATQITVGSDHSCALGADRRVRCWGNNTSGELGIGDIAERTTVVTVQGLTDVRQVAAGGMHSCAVLTAGTVSCWGANTSGEVSGAGRHARTIAVPVAGLAAKATAVATGLSHSCALLTTGAVQCWGANDRGQVGDGTRNERRAPTLVNGIGGRVIALTAGWASTCVLRVDGVVMCWGVNAHREVGDGSTAMRLSPRRVLTTSGFTQLATGATHSCARTNTGAARCWGDNEFGQLGDGTTKSSALPVDVQSMPINVPRDFVSVGPLRVLDTRPSGATADRQAQRAGLRPAGSTTEVVIAGRLGIPADAKAVFVSVSASAPAADGYLTLWPCGAARPTAATVNYVRAQTASNGALVTPGKGGKLCIFTSGATNLLLDVMGYHSHLSDFTRVAPGRLLDSRATGKTVDGKFRSLGVRKAGSVTELVVAGRGGVAPAAPTVVLNVAAVKPAANGFVTIWPCGGTRPTTSSLNFSAAATRANGAVVGVGVGGKVCIFTSATTDLVVDVAGYYPVRSSFQPLQPLRIVDSRSTGKTVDQRYQALGLRKAGAVTEVAVVSRLTLPGNVRSVALNVAVTGSAAAGSLKVWPCGGTVPNTANVHYVAGQSVAALVIVAVGPRGVCVSTSSAAHVIVDLGGYFA